jgi:hypothetical protein
MRRSCILATLGNDPHTQGLFAVARVARRAGVETHILPPGADDATILESVYRDDPEYLGFSYRLSPEVGVREFSRLLHVLAAAGLLHDALTGRPRKVALAGLPETMRAVARLGRELPAAVWTMPQQDDVLERAQRVLEYFDVPVSERPALLEDLRLELCPPTIPILDELAREVASTEDYRSEPPLPIPSRAAQSSYVQRIRESGQPILRTHFGIPSPSIQPTVEGIERLALARVVDEISLGSSDLSQRYFGKPEEFARRKNDGGVPYQTPADLAELYQATRRGNFPGIKPYAHVVDLVGFVDICLRVGMLIGAHQAVPLFWFNELDGRGPMTVPESISEHLAAVGELARRGVPVEMNDPNQWSSRWAHDTVICADYGLITSVMRERGVRDLVLQLQFNKPRETGDLADLAKMTAALALVQELLPSGPEGPRIWRETRTGIESFPPDPALAKIQLARSTFLQLIVDPQIIHLVSYCEADHAATVEDVIDSSRLVRRCVRVFRQHEPDLTKYREDPQVVARREHLLCEARFLLRRIARLSPRDRPPEDAPLGSLTPWLADPRALTAALEQGYLAAPGIFHAGYPKARKVSTTPRGGFIDCVDPQTGAVLTEEARLASLGE